MKSIPDNTAAVIVIGMFCFLMFVGIIAAAITGNENNIKDRQLAATCIENGGSWVLAEGSKSEKECVQ